MEFELSPEQREIRALARDFAEAEIEPHATECDREHTVPRELFMLGLQAAAKVGA